MPSSSDREVTFSLLLIFISVEVGKVAGDIGCGDGGLEELL